MSSTSYSWLFRMAWRDSRRNRGRLLLFVSSIILGIAALVAINSFSENLQNDINREAKTLLGADLVLEGNQPARDSIMQVLSALEEQSASNVGFVSMVLFPQSGNSRLAFISALEGDFPFYGNLNTEPMSAAKSFRTGKKALVDKSLMTQFGLANGDTVKVGEVRFTIEGKLNALPGQAQITSAIAPTIYIPQEYLAATGLVQMGSRVEYKYYYQFPSSVNPDTLAQQLKPSLADASLRITTVESRRENLGDAFQNMGNFLNLVGFIALLLGCIGVASAVHIYVRDKIGIVAVLRCLGASGRQAFLIYLFQIAAMGLVGSIIGAALGSLLQQVLPAVLADFLPVNGVSTFVSWSAIGQGVITGLAIAILFALLPLLRIRDIAPLRALRASIESPQGSRQSTALVYALIFAFVLAFSFQQTGGGWEAVLFPISIGLALLLLAGAARLLVWGVKKFFPSNSSYVVRQGVANLFRPNNQTLILMVTIGLGTTLITTLFSVQDLLLSQVRLSGSGEQPNMILFDITPEQKAGVGSLAQQHQLPLIQEVPIVALRVENIDGVTKQQNLKDTLNGKSPWVYRREYRVTYRDTLIDSEELIEGEAFGTDARSPEGRVYVSLEEGIAEDMQASVGSHIVFNVQGALMETEVRSIRKIDWRRVQTNFFVLFPSGVLEKAPQFNVIVSRSETTEQLAAFQQELVSQFPNVSLIDLTTILQSVDQVLSKVSFVIRFMAFFSILTGLLVLISSVVLSKYQRIRESVLLRTLGAKGRQILMINALEYLLLGSLAALTGLLLSTIGSFLLATFTFNIPYTPDWSANLLVIGGIALLTVLIGLFNSRDILQRPPLEVLRAEVQ